MEAKLGIPLPSEQSIERTALVRKLIDAAHTRFVLISAPVGYGKSTLLAQWSRPQWPGSRPFAAVTLDSGDNNPVALWSAVIHSVIRASPGIDGDRLIWALTTPQPDIDNVVLPSLLKEISVHCPQLVIALDNYQDITEPECHEQVNYLLNQLPAQTRLVLTTRTDPPLPLARLRAADDIIELRMAELRFTRDEIVQLFRRVDEYHIDIDGQHIDGQRFDEKHEQYGQYINDLAERTEGWPTAVHLAARLLRNQRDPVTFLRCFGGDNRYVMDYLEEEVLRHLPGAVQRFLARTSILDHFTAPLCDAVSGTTNSADLLDGLERANLFLVPMDGVRAWYRYHRLFGQALRAQLTRTEPGAAATLHQKASAWYEHNGRAGEAIKHALAADATDRAIELVARHWAHYLYQGELATIRSWLGTLGADRIGQSPRTAICAAWSATLSGERLAGQRWLTTAQRLGHQGELPDGMHSLRGAVALYQGTFGFGGVDEKLAAARLAADLHRDVTSPWYAQARVALGDSYYLAGEAAAAVAPLEQAGQAAIRFPVLRILALSVLSLVTGDLGRTAQAADLAAIAHDLVQAQGLSESSEVTLAQVAYAAALVREGHLLRARHELTHAVRLRRSISGLPPWPTLTALILLARVLLALGERDEARALLGEATDLLAVLPDGADRVRIGLAEIERKLAGVEHPAVAIPQLTDRERAVLRLLQGSLPLREVAAQLFVSANTIKSHTRLIYRKLGASSRTEAVRRARELGLL